MPLRDERDTVAGTVQPRRALHRTPMATLPARSRSARTRRRSSSRGATAGDPTGPRVRSACQPTPAHSCRSGRPSDGRRSSAHPSRTPPGRGRDRSRCKPSRSCRYRPFALAKNGRGGCRLTGTFEEISPPSLLEPQMQRRCVSRDSPVAVRDRRSPGRGRVPPGQAAGSGEAERAGGENDCGRPALTIGAAHGPQQPHRALPMVVAFAKATPPGPTSLTTRGRRRRCRPSR